MSIQQISYDLRAPGRSYQPLYDAIKSYKTWCHPLESTWLVVTTESAATVHGKLWRHMDSNDGLLVTGLTGEAAWLGLSREVSQWLREQLSRGSAARLL